MTLKRTDLDLLNNMRIRRGAMIANVSEGYRQRLIGWAMQEPPLVEVDGPRVSVTTAGEALLKREGLMK